MAQPNPLRRNLLAIVSLAVVVFLTVALATYHPSDPVAATLGPFSQFYHPDQVEYPARSGFQNACGRWGALSADLLLTGFGVGGYYCVVSLGALSITLLRREVPDMPALRATGWLGSLVGVSSLAAILLPDWSPGPIAGSGGYLGALGGGLLQHHFALFGSLILSGSFVLGGLLMCSDHLLPAVLKWVFGGFLLAALRRHSHTASGTAEGPTTGKPNKSKPVKIAVGKTTRKTASNLASSDLDAPSVAAGDAAAEDGDEPTILPIRVRGKNSARAAVDDEADELDDEADESRELGDDVDDSEELDEYEDVEDEPLPPPTKPRRGANPTTKAGIAAVNAAAAARGANASPPAETGPASAPHFKIKNPDARAEVLAELQEGGMSDTVDDYELPALDLLVAGESVDWENQEKEVRRKAKVLEKTFADFGFQVRVVEIETGPVIAQYEVELEAGLRLSKITSLADDLAIALRVPSVRIVAPIPGKNTVGIEVPNEERQVVRLREVIEETNGKIKKMRIPLFLGKDVSGNALTADLSTLPHLLIAGRTGTGKSVCLNAIITSILMTRRPDEVRMIMIDPKMVELSGYGRLPHLMHPVVTDMRKAEAILAWAVEKMEERYALLARAGVRHISNYNQLGEEELCKRLQPEDEDARANIPKQLPFIVIVADEIADMMMTAGKEVEQHIIRLAQKSRAVGIHLILATQKPTVDVITGLIKSNLPARISFQVASRTDSRVVLDEMGADKLLGNGDMLFLWPGTSTLLRGQGTYLGDDEINRVVDCCSQGRPQNFATELVNIKVQDESDGGLMEKLKKRDELYESAVDVVIREGRGSCSLLQRALGIGYGRAARLIDFMAEDGIVGNYAGSQAREVLLSVEDWEQMQARGSAEGSATAAPAEPPRKRSNRVVPEPSPAPAPRSSKKSPPPIASRPAPEEEELSSEDEEEELEDDFEADESSERQSSEHLDSLSDDAEVDSSDDEDSDTDEQSADEFDDGDSSESRRRKSAMRLRTDASSRSNPTRNSGRKQDLGPRRGVISLLRTEDLDAEDE
jgi:S-DNA-T family DNA segregation ATPase FtsK/SpoIIIE